MVTAGNIRFRWPLRDVQQDIPVARCRRCGGEIYDYEDEEDGLLCPDCRAEEADLIRTGQHSSDIRSQPSPEGRPQV